LAGGRTRLHAPSPFGRGTVGPGLIEHHKFLVRPYPERHAIWERYHALRPDASTWKFLPFQLPEDAFGVVETEPYLDDASVAA
jgi:hypothetical protein